MPSAQRQPVLATLPHSRAAMALLIELFCVLCGFCAFTPPRKRLHLVDWSGHGSWIRKRPKLPDGLREGQVTALSVGQNASVERVSCSIPRGIHASANVSRYACFIVA